MKPQNLSTKEKITWCPGCPNFAILESVKRAISDLINKEKFKKTDFVLSTGIGCNSKIFDYLDLNGFYGLNGRAIPLAMGIKLANPNLKVLIFAGDGDTYSEGIEHFVHAFRYNTDMSLFVHDNQSFSLTTGQATPTSQKGFKTKVDPYGDLHEPLNPLKIALASGATFIARCNAMDIEHTKEIMKKAIKHKGFSYVEIMQKCLIFNTEMNDLDKIMYKIPDNPDYNKAIQLTSEWDYNTKTGKIPLGILYQTTKPDLNQKIKDSRK